jgi:hypothetical protein
VLILTATLLVNELINDVSVPQVISLDTLKFKEIGHSTRKSAEST